MTIHKVEFTAEEKRRVRELLTVCHSKQGEYLPVHHGPGSWATTYGNEFVEAATELFAIFSKAKKAPPIPGNAGTRYFLNAVFDLMAQEFNKHGIRSCRGFQMDIDRVRYLFEAYILRKINRGEHTP